MSEIVTRGELVYRCDTCKRTTRIPQIPRGIDTLRRCVITKSCQGTMHKTQVAPASAVSEAVEGVEDWFQRRLQYKHTQTIASKRWIFDHDLGSIPSIQVYSYQIDPTTLEEELAETTNYTVESTTTSTIITFPVKERGVAECLVLSSTASRPAEAVAPDTVIVTANGELTLATLDDDSSIDVLLRYRDTGNGIDFDVTYTSVDNIPSVNSPWVGSSEALINGKRYTLRSFNIVTSPLGPNFFAANLASSGFATTFPELGTTYGRNLILLSKAPFSLVDRITDRYIDVAEINRQTTPTLILNSGELETTATSTRSVYPPISAL
jgi:hypothetical protein